MRFLSSIFRQHVIFKIDNILMMDYKFSSKFCASIIHTSMEPIIYYIQEWDIMQYAFWCHFPTLYSSHVSSALSLERFLSAVRNKSVVNGRYTHHLRTFTFYHYKKYLFKPWFFLTAIICQKKVWLRTKHVWTECLIE